MAFTTHDALVRREILAADPSFHSVLEAAVGGQLDRGAVECMLRDVTPWFERYSPDSVPTDEQLAADYCTGLLGPSSVAMNSIDPTTAGRRWSQGDYPYFSRGAGDLTFPERGLREFFAAHLFFRAVVYLDLGELLGCTYRADAVRSPVVEHLLGGNPAVRRSFAEVVIRHVSAEQERRDAVVNGALGCERFAITVPLPLKGVLSRASRRDEILAVALDVRESKEATRFRSFCAAVDEAIATGNRQEVESAIRELSAYGIELADSLRGSAESPLQATQELVSYTSPLAGALLPLLKGPAEHLYRAVRFRKFALLDHLRAVPRAVDDLERELAGLPQGSSRGRGPGCWPRRFSHARG